MFTGLTPYYPETGPVKIYNLVVKNVRPPRLQQMAELGLCDDLWALVDRSWDSEPRNRPTITEFRDEFQAIRGRLGTFVPRSPPQWPLKLSIVSKRPVQVKVTSLTQ